MSNLPGYRNAIMVLRALAEMVEKDPAFTVPTVTLNPHPSVHDNLSFTVSEYSLDYTLPHHEREEARIRSIENKFHKIMDALGPDVEWVTNDPSSGEYYDKTYFQLKGEWMGMVATISCDRTHIGEFVTVIDSGPQVLHELDGSVQAVRQNVTIWKPNISLARRSVPAYEIESTPLALAIEG